MTKKIHTTPSKTAASAVLKENQSNQGTATTT
jgi:hypothetical protein